MNKIDLIIEALLIRVIKLFNLKKRDIKRSDNSLYLTRYYIFRKRKKWQPSIYLHCFHDSDWDYELHNHPWKRSLSFILAGSYLEERRKKDNSIKIKIYSPGSFNYIKANDFHRIEKKSDRIWTLFVSGSKQQRWGFWDRDTFEYIDFEEHDQRKQLINA